MQKKNSVMKSFLCVDFEPNENVPDMLYINMDLTLS